MIRIDWDFWSESLCSGPEKQGESISTKLKCIWLSQQPFMLVLWNESGKKKKVYASMQYWAFQNFYFSSFSFSPNSTWMYTVEIITCWSIEKYFTFCDKSNIWYHIWLIRVLCWKIVLYVEVGEKAVVLLLEIRTVVSNGTFALA